MKKLNLWMALIVLIMTTQAFASEWDDQQQGRPSSWRSRSEGKPIVDPNRKVSYIDHRLAKLLVDNVTDMDQQRLYGKWKLVIVGPAENESVGYYDSSGIRQSSGQPLTITISATETSWLPASVNRQTIVVPSEDLKVDFTTVAKANEPNAAALEGNFFVLKLKNLSLKCGFVNSNTDHLICIRSQTTSYDAKIIGFERM